MEENFESSRQDMKLLSDEMAQFKETTRDLRESVRPLNSEVAEFRNAGLDPLLRKLEQVTVGSKKAGVALAEIGASLAENLALQLGAGIARRESLDLGATLSEAIGKTIFGYRAAGGPVSKGNPFVVGEKGPELFVPDSAGDIIAADRFAGRSAGAVNITIKNTSGHDVQARATRRVASI